MSEKEIKSIKAKIIMKNGDEVEIIDEKVWINDYLVYEPGEYYYDISKTLHSGADKNDICGD